MAVSDWSCTGTAGTGVKSISGSGAGPYSLSVPMTSSGNLVCVLNDWAGQSFSVQAFVIHSRVAVTDGSGLKLAGPVTIGSFGFGRTISLVTPL